LGETKFILSAMTMSLVANVILGFALIRTIGWLGPALSALLTGYLFAGLIMIAIRKRLNLTFGRLLPWRALGQVSLVAVLAAAGSLAAVFLPIGSVWQFASGFVIFATIYLIGNLKTNAITQSDVDTVRGWMWVASRIVFGRDMLESGTRE
jgi:O-antigen/teichoic acid export membrane protein